MTHPQLVRELSRFARTLVTDRPVEEGLREHAASAAAILGIHGAAISLDRGGRLVLVAASSEAVAILERVQEREQDGPGVDACRSGHRILVPQVAAYAERWPALTEAALRIGIVTVGAVPLRLDHVDLGTLDLYDTTPHDWTEEEAMLAESLAALIAGYLANAARIEGFRKTVDQLQEALDNRVVIEQAKGMLAAERGISVDDAFEALRSHARTRGVPLRDVARAVVHLGLRP